jgi:cytochrome c553
MNKFLTAPIALMTALFTTFAAQAQEVKGDVKAGESKIAMCIGCHGIPGYQASFPEVYKVPKISGQNAKYIVAALNAYKKGDRKHPSMRGIAYNLTEQDMADLAAYYEQHGKTDAPPKPASQPSEAVAKLIEKGACIACHGEGFAKPVDPSYPKVAGQYKDYLFVALKSYKTEGHNTWGRNNAVMGGVAKQFTNAELKALAGYIGSLDGELKVIPQPKMRK